MTFKSKVISRTFLNKYLMILTLGDSHAQKEQP